jgi:murein DD-endopeptidase MepM/ murein hydrolase activator NlpD
VNRLVVTFLLGLSSAAGAQEYRLPFGGRWFVMQGGDTPNVNEHMGVPAQWFGLDFAKVGGPSQRELTRGIPAKVEDYFAWGESVEAPIGGEIVAVMDGLPDNHIGVKDPQHPAGNYVVLKAAEGRYLFLAHFQRGSITVAVGQRVEVGQRLGSCGNSGNSDFPHIHMHIQNTSALNTGRGQNPVFAHIDVELTGAHFADVTWPLIRGLFVANH